MKTLETLISLLALTFAGLANEEMRPGIDKDIPLAEGIRRANEQFACVPPLTEEEVIAAVHAIKLNDPEIKEAIYEIFQRVAKERVLPKGMYFGRIQHWGPSKEGYMFNVDWKDLTLTPLPVGTKDEKIGYGYGFRLRARFISSHQLTNEERQTIQRLQELQDRAKNVEPDGAANGSQPIRSETNRTSSAAGSRR
jgi:hypothetical protein